MSGRIYIKGFGNSDAHLTYTDNELLEMGLYLEPIYKDNFKLKK